MLTRLDLLRSEKFPKKSLDIHPNLWYNIHMNDRNNPFDIAMDLSSGVFAHHLYGVLSVMHKSGDPTPSVDSIAAEYLDTFYEGWDVDEEPREDWDDESALASAGFGMDESYE